MYVYVYTKKIMSLLHIFLIKNLAVAFLFIFIEIPGQESTILLN